MADLKAQWASVSPAVNVGFTDQGDGTYAMVVSATLSGGGDATAANQVIGNASLSSINGKLPATLGQKTAAGSLSVVLSSDNNNVTATGNVASGAADSGNPLKIGGLYSATPPTLTDGQRGNIQLDSLGSVAVALKAFNGLNFAASSTNADAKASTSQNNSLSTVNYGFLYNNSTYDRVRSIAGVIANSNAVTGITAVANVGSSFTRMTTAATTTIKSGAGILYKVIINTLAASATITMYDNTAGSGTVIGVITNPATLVAQGPISAEYGLNFATGLTVVTTGTQDITFVWR